MGVWYCTREQVKTALDIKETARDNLQVDRAIESASRGIEGLMHRKFYPMTTTRYFPFPSYAFGNPAWQLWLENDEIVTLTSMTSGSVSILPANVFLEPVNEGPPFNRIELDQSSNASFGQGVSPQHDIAITGVFGYGDSYDSAGTLAANLDGFTTTVGISNSSTIGVGSVIRIDSERMIVTDKQSVATSQTLQTAMTAQNANMSVGITDGTQFFIGEVITIDTERMLIQDILGNNLVVKRAWDGFPLATHDIGSAIYVMRNAIVQRGALGTAAVSHGTGPIGKLQIPGTIRALCVAESINQVQQELSSYARVVGSGDNQRNASGAGLEDMRQRAYIAFGRKARLRVI